eukprot:gnl/Spiro4/5064_TR2525_c0_g1_i1.p1 gnl/Spiro4/5064_TR2525_c0_g1~~gnl/Spiro4/5064_TR2525_c0_g1_i1.p1  ORF type:complete len:252 (+),score=49.28 gnl/Spiro4/5064_TR2525_c0_g1_i1:146-901(+)
MNVPHHHQHQHQHQLQLYNNNSTIVNTQQNIGMMPPSVRLYDLWANYKFKDKEAKVEKDPNVKQRMVRQAAKYEREGLRRTVEGVLLVHHHNHPHVLLLCIGGTFFKLPGGRLRPGENECDGLKRKLNNKLAPHPQHNHNPHLHLHHSGPLATSAMPEWEIGDLLAQWWRPKFEPLIYPYIPPHVTKPKECRKLFLVQLPERCTFAKPMNLDLVAVPLHLLYDNAPQYGPIISTLPQILARYNFMCVNSTE